MWLCTVLWWSGLLSTLLVCSAMDPEDRTYQPFPGFHHARSFKAVPRPYILPIPGHEPDDWEQLADGAGSSAPPQDPIGSAHPSTVPPYVAQLYHPANNRHQSLYGPGPDPIAEERIDGTIVKKVKPFFMDDHRQYGPYSIGLWKFENRPYPVDIPLLQNNYVHDSKPPIDFEFTGAGRAALDEPLFRPEPQVLKRIQDLLTTTLRRGDWQPKPNDPSDARSALEGEFLWPPVQLQPDVPNQLMMKKGIRTSFSMAVAKALEYHHETGRGVWTLELRYPGMMETRKIMMVWARADLNTVVTYRNRKSHFWLFYEALQDQAHGGRPRLALLGGTFLPWDAVDHLYFAGVLRAAHANVLSYMH
ncbi:conserved hypothetical Ustilaginaceae-specific protein [Sporisorium reilianum SRZ2]|uniref:Conserved hypothetical Ustilaginaceae-specific protein n=1 Tax=Sporisorium reilianum (strain SRZ2) TaxID=999809 RepID=E6ZZY8_SPORE|nr:conserved hypothetical Ustilaginaceae-specific protein [Sporisorium reilianum SRZ2]